MMDDLPKLPERQPCKRCGRVHTEPPMTTERALALAAKPLAEQIEADIYAAAIRKGAE